MTLRFRSTDERRETVVARVAGEPAEGCVIPPDGDGQLMLTARHGERILLDCGPSDLLVLCVSVGVGRGAALVGTSHEARAEIRAERRAVGGRYLTVVGLLAGRAPTEASIADALRFMTTGLLDLECRKRKMEEMVLD